MTKAVISFLFLLLGCSHLMAQSNSLQYANQLMQQQRYNEALPILTKLAEDDSRTPIYSNLLIDCLIQLKQYDKALDAAREFRKHPENQSQADLRIGELHHFKGEKEKALEVWKSNVETHSNQLQLYINTARTMIDRREYRHAVDVYKKARQVFQNDHLFFGDIANAYLQAGEYELAVEEWINLLKDAPNQISSIQRSLLRFDDPILYDVTIMELDDQLRRVAVNSNQFKSFYQLQIWLLQENKLFRRALAAARSYESKSTSYNYSLFNLGRQLRNNNEFELAVEAFQYYIDNSYGEVKWRNMEELSNTYSKWAKFIDDYRLDFYSQRDSLFQLSYSMLESILNETQNFSRLQHIHLKKAELSLDFIYDLSAAEASVASLRTQSGMTDAPELHYLQGRIHLTKKEFSRARVSFTKANKKAGIGELAEKTRYFLALTDFYSGDYDFAAIQLKSLGRQNTSYYANDALELRIWLQEGLAVDSIGADLDRFAEAVFQDKNGRGNESAPKFLEMAADPAFSLKTDAMLFALHSRHIPDTTKLDRLSAFIAATRIIPKKEKLLWEQAKLLEKHASGEATANDIYEELILSYPNGFYAPFARERLNRPANEHS